MISLAGALFGVEKSFMVAEHYRSNSAVSWSKVRSQDPDPLVGKVVPCRVDFLRLLVGA